MKSHLWYIGSVVFTIVSQSVELVHLLFQIRWTSGYWNNYCVTDRFIVEKSVVDGKIDVVHIKFYTDVVHNIFKIKTLDGVPTLVRRGELGLYTLSITHHVDDNCFSFFLFFFKSQVIQTSFILLPNNIQGHQDLRKENGKTLLGVNDNCISSAKYTKV